MNKVFVFIDAHNLHCAIREEGWDLDWKRLFIYLRDKYKVERVYVFLGKLSNNQDFYDFLIAVGYRVIFKKVIQVNGKIKANVDAELVLQSMIQYPHYEKAILISNDGDFACLVEYWFRKGKLLAVLAPNFRKCSTLLKQAARGQMWSLLQVKEKLIKK